MLACSPGCPSSPALSIESALTNNNKKKPRAPGRPLAKEPYFNTAPKLKGAQAPPVGFLFCTYIYMYLSLMLCSSPLKLPTYWLRHSIFVNRWTRLGSKTLETFRVTLSQNLMRRVVHRDAQLYAITHLC